MGSYSQLNYHIVFATKHRHPSIKSELKDRLYEYMGGTLRAKKGQLIEIGGVADHVHLLARLSPTSAVSDVIRDIKANSSKWINELDEIKRPFHWQIGYSVFSVSYSHIDTVREYIQNQEEHHKTMTFQEEYEAFLTRHGISFRPEYLFEDEHHG